MRIRSISMLVLIVSAPLVLGACSGSSLPSTDSETSPAAPSTSPTPVDSTAVDIHHVIGGGQYPEYELEVPGGWSSGDEFTTRSGPTVMGMSVWDVGEVPRDPCRWKGSLADPGPSVDDLVAALVAQRYRHASAPAPVTLGGAEGVKLQWSVPTDWKVTGDADFEGCDDPGNGHQDFVSWLGDGKGERYQQVPGQVDKLWILEVGDQRLVVDATYSPDSTDAEVKELLAVVESLRFER
jgi:hypothetical protein